MIKISELDEHGVENYKTWYLLSVSMGILFSWVALGAAGVLYFEQGASSANVHTYGDAFWLLILSCSTIGFGDYFAVTFMGRVIVGCSFFVGVGVAGYIGALLANSVLGFSDTNVKNRELMTLLHESIEQDGRNGDRIKGLENNIQNLLDTISKREPI